MTAPRSAGTVLGAALVPGLQQAIVRALQRVEAAFPERTSEDLARLALTGALSATVVFLREAGCEAEIVRAIVNQALDGFDRAAAVRAGGPS